MHLLYTTSLTDVCFNKKIEQDKKSFYKSISKLIYVDTCYLLFVIIVTECNALFFFKSQKDGVVASVNYLKVKNKVTYWTTVIPDSNQIHAAPNFLLLSNRFHVYVAIACYTLLHQATKCEGKNSLKERRDILVLIVIPNDFFYCTTLSLIYDVLPSFRLYYIQFKEVKILWGPGAG